MAVLSLTWKSPYVDKTVFILRRGPDPWQWEPSALGSCGCDIELVKFNVISKNRYIERFELMYIQVNETWTF